MAKRKNTTTPKKDDMKVASIVIGLFAAAVILFFIFSKGKEVHQKNIPTLSAPVNVSSPVENIEPVVPRPYVPLTPEPVQHIPGTGGKIAFIIDDWGQISGPCKFLKEIPEPIAVSILPGLRHTKDVANCAERYHKLVMLHLPLEAMHNADPYPPDYIIKTNMKQALVTKIVEEDLAQLPHLEGVNNHMGSKATSNKPLMRIIFKIIKKRGLFFVDSMTSPHSVCTPLADEMGLSFGKRDVFLDNVVTRDAILKQFMDLAQKARHKGYAVAIGHAFNHLTMQILKEEIPSLEKQGFEIVSIKELLKTR